MKPNLKITKQELKDLRALPDFDLIMVLSDLAEIGVWEIARKTLSGAVKAVAHAKTMGWEDTSGKRRSSAS